MSDYKKEAIDFLLYSYFGIAPGYLWEKRVKYAIMKAYGDATAQGAYNTLFSTKGADKEKIDRINSLKKESEKAKNKSAQQIFSKINELFESTDDNDFDDWHNDLCIDIVKKFSEIKYDEVTFFTYGNAQKWINMTIKYICILDALSEEKESTYHNYIENHFKDFHVPVDSYIIEAIWKDTSIKLPTIDGVDREKKKYDTNKIEAWSKWTIALDSNKNEINPYKAFQESLAENKFKASEDSDSIKSSLEWENETWIAQAEKRKHADKEKRYNSFFGNNSNN